MASSLTTPEQVAMLLGASPKIAGWPHGGPCRAEKAPLCGPRHHFTKQCKAKLLHTEPKHLPQDTRKAPKAVGSSLLAEVRLRLALSSAGGRAPLSAGTFHFRPRKSFTDANDANG